jgi:hypothetical protein
VNAANYCRYVAIYRHLALMREMCASGEVANNYNTAIASSFRITTLKYGKPSSVILKGRKKTQHYISAGFLMSGDLLEEKELLLKQC